MLHFSIEMNGFRIAHIFQIIGTPGEAEMPVFSTKKKKRDARSLINKA